MPQNSYKLILASQSPRRKELLGWIGVPFEIIKSDVDEISNEQDPIVLSMELAAEKGRDVFTKLSSWEGFKENFFPVIVASDTVVAEGNNIYGKPTSVEDARRILGELSDKKHTVVTGVHLSMIDKTTLEFKEHSFYVKSDVEFDEITEDLMDIYLGSKESLDKAGAYGIQGQGLTFIKSLSGSYSNVVGFPLSDFINQLKFFMGMPDDKDGQWRKLFK
jgi:septum formation protein